MGQQMSLDFRSFFLYSDLMYPFYARSHVHHQRDPI